MPTVLVPSAETPPCGVGSLPFRGEVYHLYLNQKYFTSDVTKPIPAEFVREVLNPHGKKSYEFCYKVSDLPEGVAILQGCHVGLTGCVKGCCGEAFRQIMLMGTELDLLRQQINDQGIVTSFCSGKTLITQFADGRVITTPTPSCMPKPGVPCAGELCIAVSDGGLYHFRSPGGASTLSDLLAVGSPAWNIFRGGSSGLVVDFFTEDPTDPSTTAYSTLRRFYAAEAAAIAGVTEGWREIGDGTTDHNSAALPEYFRIRIGEGKSGSICLSAASGIQYYHGDASGVDIADPLTYANIPWVRDQSAGAPGTTCSTP